MYILRGTYAKVIPVIKIPDRHARRPPSRRASVGKIVGAGLAVVLPYNVAGGDELHLVDADFSGTR